MSAAEAQELVAGLAASHGEQLLRFLRARVANVADVPDIAQEVYLRMLRIPNADSIRSPEAYFFTVARHVLQQYTLKTSATTRPVELTDSLLSTATASDANPALEAHAQQCMEQMERALEELTPKARATFVLHRREGLSLEEIAVCLEISVSLVKKHLMNALLHLRQGLDKQE